MTTQQSRIPTGFSGLPLWVFLAVYGVTCVAAAIPLAFEYQPLRILVGYFAGLGIPAGFDPRTATVFWALLLVAPLCMALGYQFGLWASRGKFNQPPTPLLSHEPGFWAGGLTFLASAVWAFWTLTNAGAFEQLGNWWDYGAWVTVRWALFESLGFFEFTNLYVWLPLSCAWVVISTWARGGRVRWAGMLAILVTCGFALVLFQKKALMVTLLLVLFAGCLYARRRGVHGSVLRRWGCWALTVLTVVYLTMVVVPVWNDASTKLEQDDSSTKLEQNDSSTKLEQNDSSTKLEQNDLSTSVVVSGEVLSALLGDRRSVHVAAYALLSPFSRTSISAFYYTEVFPRRRPFYGLDVGLDVLGLGGMPDDNLVVWDAMYPRMRGGSASAPFQFILYSQVGLGGALLGSVLLGALLAIAWVCITAQGLSAVASSVLGALLLLFAVFLAIDSPRNSLISSYGLLWGVAMVGVLSVLSSVSRRCPPRAVPSAHMERL